MKKVLKWGLIVVAGLFVIGLLAPDPESGTAAGDAVAGTEEPAAPVAPAAADVEVGADELFADYEANEVAADQKYKGKRLKVAGTVEGINKNAFDSIYVEIATSNEFSSIHANGIPEQTAASLQKGQQLTVVCEGAGLMVGSPILDDCAVL
jgi:hypothetical protein